MNKKSLSVFAAQVCTNYCVSENGTIPCSRNTALGYGDWYLPSAYELFNMWKSKALNLSGQYWSSTEDSPTEAIFQNEYGQSYGQKYIAIQVRCIRSF